MTFSLQMQEFPEGGVLFQEHGKQLGAHHSWTFTEMKGMVDWLKKDISRLKEEELRAKAEADGIEGSMMRAIIIWEIFNQCTQGVVQGPSDITNKLISELRILEEVHKLLLRKKNLFHGKSIENLHEDARSKLIESVKQALFRIQRQKFKVQSCYRPYLQYIINRKLPFLSATAKIEEFPCNDYQESWPYQGFVSISPNFDQQQVAGKLRAENDHISNDCFQITELYMPSGPLSEGINFDSIDSSKTPSSVHNYGVASSEENPQCYKNCNGEGRDAIYLQASNWVNVMPVGNTITSYMPMNLDESAAPGTFSQHAFPMIPEATANDYPTNSIILTALNKTQDDKVNALIKTEKVKQKKEKPKKKEKFNKKEQKGKAGSSSPDGGCKIKATFSSETTQLQHERGPLTLAAMSPSEEYHESPQFEEFQGQAGVYSQNPPLQVDPWYYETKCMPLCFQTQAPAMVQIPSDGFSAGMTWDSGFQPVLYSHPDFSTDEHHDDDRLRTPLSSKTNKKKKHNGPKPTKKAVLSQAESSSQDVLEKQGQQLIGVGGLPGDVADAAQIHADGQKSNKVKNKGKKTKGRGSDANIQRAEQKPKRKNKKKKCNVQEIGEHPSTAQVKRITFFVTLLQAFQCKQADNWLRKVAPELWLRLVKAGACKMSRCCTLALQTACGKAAIKNVFSLLLRFASSTLRRLCWLLRQILHLLQHLATSFFQFGARICRCMCACSDKLIPNLTACISAPIKAILKCAIAIVRAPCRLLCSKTTGQGKRRRRK